MQGQVAQAAERTAPAADAARELKADRRRELVPYLLLFPAVVFLMIFFAWPMIQALVLAFQDSNGAWSLREMSATKP